MVVYHFHKVDLLQARQNNTTMDKVLNAMEIFRRIFFSFYQVQWHSFNYLGMTKNDAKLKCYFSALRKAIKITDREGN